METLNWRRFLTAHSRRRFALSVTKGCLVSALAWIDGTAVMPMFSHLSLGKIGFFVTSLVKLKRRIKLSSVRCLEHIDEFCVGSHFVLFFGLFFASGCSLLKKDIACKIKPFHICKGRTPSEEGGEEPDTLADSDSFFAWISVSGRFFFKTCGSCNCSGWWF